MSTITQTHMLTITQTHMSTITQTHMSTITQTHMSTITQTHMSIMVLQVSQIRAHVSRLIMKKTDGVVEMYDDNNFESYLEGKLNSPTRN